MINDTEQKTKTCKYSNEEYYLDEKRSYETECGEILTLIDGNLKDNCYKYCPFCGSKIILKE